MKKILFALAIVPILAFVGCSSDDDDKASDNFGHNIDMLYGEWRATGVKVGGVTIDLTEATNELLVEPTYVTFAKGGIYSSEGVLGNGTGKFTTKDKTIFTTLGSKKISFEMTSLEASTAKINVDAKALGLPALTGDAEVVTVMLTKNYSRDVDFDHNVEHLYGEWRATSVEGVYEEDIDLTNPVVEQLVKPTYVTFDKRGVYSSKGVFGEGTGRYATKGKTVFTLLGEKAIDFEMTSLDANSARIILNPQDVDFGLEIPAEVKMVTVVLTKQADK